MNVMSPGDSIMSTSSGRVPSGSAHLKCCTMCPIMDATRLIPSCAPGHTRRPAPNGSTRKSAPLMSMFSWRKRSGRNSSGSSQTLGSRATAQTLTMTLAPLGMS
uniref:Uncharacterized protein n=1 Tax=Arundo donax TaxID=35708 RepID=A0A0A9F4H6_ARUDO